jgi:hypothetical protein
MNPDPGCDDLPERRLKPRITCDYFAWIQGRDEDGGVFEEAGKAVNLSQSGAYLMVCREIAMGSELSIKISIPSGSLKLGTSKLAVRGKVVRGEFRSETSYGIAVRFQYYRFL